MKNHKKYNLKFMSEKHLDIFYTSIGKRKTESHNKQIKEIKYTNQILEIKNNQFNFSVFINK